MSGVLRLSNNVTGRSTINASASNDQTYTLPALGGTLVTGGASSELIFPPGTEALPYKTVNYGVSQLSSGDIIEIDTENQNILKFS